MWRPRLAFGSRFSTIETQLMQLMEPHTHTWTPLMVCQPCDCRDRYHMQRGHVHTSHQLHLPNESTTSVLCAIAGSHPLTEPIWWSEWKLGMQQGHSPSRGPEINARQEKRRRPTEQNKTKSLLLWPVEVWGSSTSVSISWGSLQEGRTAVHTWSLVQLHSTELSFSLDFLEVVGS